MLKKEVIKEVLFVSETGNFSIKIEDNGVFGAVRIGREGTSATMYIRCELLEELELLLTDFNIEYAKNLRKVFREKNK